MQQTVAGTLLAGGLSRRMGGAEKALMTLRGRPLIAHAAERMAPQVASLILSANGDPARFASLALPVVPDETADLPGPLAGVLAALHWFAENAPQVSAMVSLPADTPLAPPDLVSRLRDGLAASPGAPVAVAQSRGRRHPVIALWTRPAAAEIAAALARGERRAEAIIDRLGAVAVPFPDLDIAGRTVDPFFNINTPEDLAAAEKILSLCSPPHESEGAPPFVVGVAGWKNSGKTTLVARLVAELVRRGYRVSTVKHSHHAITRETAGTDSARHKAAGAQTVVVVSPAGWAHVDDGPELALDADPEPPLSDVVAQLAPSDIVIVEGMKHAPIPKIEVRRRASNAGPPLAARDPLVFAIAADHPVRDPSTPAFSLDDVDGIARALLAAAGLADRKVSP